MLLGGALIYATTKARRQFAMRCGFVRIAPMGDGSDRCSKAVQCPQKFGKRQRVPLYGSERLARKALTGPVVVGRERRLLGRISCSPAHLLEPQCPSMHYHTVFDVATAGYKSWTFPASGLIFIAIGAVLVANRKNLPGRWSKRPKASNAFAFFFLGFAVLWTLSSFLSTYGEYTTLSTASESDGRKVVEGAVTDFRPMPVTGHAMEKFCVSGACFEYSDYVITGGFNNTSLHGGPIREGLQVRVTYVDNAIVKLEIAE